MGDDGVWFLCHSCSSLVFLTPDLFDSPAGEVVQVPVFWFVYADVGWLFTAVHADEADLGYLEEDLGVLWVSEVRKFDCHHWMPP